MTGRSPRRGFKLLLAAALALPGGLAGQDASAVRVFAPGVVTVEDGSVYGGVFTPDGDGFYFFRKVTEGAEEYRIFSTRRTADGWSAPERVDLGGEHSDLYPALSPDGSRMIFSSYRETPEGPSRQANLWYVDRTADGWGEPVYMAAQSDRRAYNPGTKWGPDGWIRYKAEVWGPRPSRRHLRIRAEGDGFTAPEPDPLFDPFEGWRDDVRLWEGTLSPDGDTMILGVSELDPETGRARPSDLWVTRRDGGDWSEPVRLGPGVSSPGWETHVTFTPDGRELLFARGFSSYHAVPVAALPGG